MQGEERNKDDGDTESDDQQQNDNEEDDEEAPTREIGSSIPDDFGRSSTTSSTAAIGDNQNSGREENSADTVASLMIAARRKLPSHPNVVQIIQKPRTHVNHTYHDLSDIPNDGTYSLPGDIDRMTFPEKLFHLISSTSSYAQESIVWRPHGRAFRIKSEEYLQKYGLLKLYFGYARIQRFFKQLLNHDFKEITQGPDKGSFYNEYFLRGMPHLLQYFPASLERRRLLPDPENEPNFEEIAQLFYLPGDRRLIAQEARNRLQRRGIQIWDSVFESVAGPQVAGRISGVAQQSAQNPLIASLPPSYASYPPAGAPTGAHQRFLGLTPFTQQPPSSVGTPRIHSPFSGRSFSLGRTDSGTAAAGGETDTSVLSDNSEQKATTKKKQGRKRR